MLINRKLTCMYTTTKTFQSLNMIAIDVICKATKLPYESHTQWCIVESTHVNDL